VLDGKDIAVKKLRAMPGIDEKQFENEFGHLRRLKHQNIVQLVGFCNEEEEVVVNHEGKEVLALDIHRALCLEFVPNGSLGSCLSGLLVPYNVLPDSTRKCIRKLHLR
jgi:coatomer subunit beta'